MKTILISNTTGSGVGVTVRARQLGRMRGGAFRAPHFSCSTAALLGELALAAGGTLYLDEVFEFRLSSLRTLIQTWRRMDASVRPWLVLGAAFIRPDYLPKDWTSHDHHVAESLPPIDQHDVVQLVLATSELEVVA